MTDLSILRVLRAKQWAHFAPLPLAMVERSALDSPRDLGRAALAVAAASLCLGYAYGINAIADRASDASASKNPLAGVETVPLGAKVVVFTAAALALATSLSLGLFATGLTVASLAAGTLYSVGPRLKAWPVAGALFNTVIFAPLLGLALRDGASAPRGAAVLSLTFVGLIFQSQLLHEAEDAEEDARGRVFTTARWLGPRLTRIVATWLAAPFALLAIALAPGAGLGVTAVAALAGGAAVAFFERDFAAARRAHRYVTAAGGALVLLVRFFS